MLLILLSALAIAGVSGLVAAVYRGILAYEPILNWWFRFGNKYEKKWFFKPIWGCHLCIGGQFGLWLYLLLVAMPTLLNQYGQISTFGNGAVYCATKIVSLIFGLLIAICGAIYSAKKIMETIKK